MICKLIGHKDIEVKHTIEPDAIYLFCLRCKRSERVSKEEIVIKSAKQPKGKAVFLSEPTAEEELELEQPEWKRKLWDKVRMRK